MKATHEANELRLGVNADDFRLPLRDALRQAGALRFPVVEFGAGTGDAAPPNLSSSGRKHLRRYADGLGLRIASVGADLPGLRFTDPRTVQERIDRTCGIISLAADLGVAVVTAAAGGLCRGPNAEFDPLALEALQQVADFADSRGRLFALRPSLDGADRLARLLNHVGCPSLRIGLDPAALVMSGVNPAAVIEHLAGSICLVHARDGTAGRAEHAGHETALGEGDVDLVGVLCMLAAAEYGGAYLLRRTDSSTPVADLQRARETLHELRASGFR
ncbi:MAG: sugar phosphate isomerase/epimerase [Planctomycetes bacterium]|nr:sugar phosphate isomerase/epimerase [Planctomycetota bacterium]